MEEPAHPDPVGDATREEQPPAPESDGRGPILIDSHAHLDAVQFDRDRAAVLERAQRAGVAYVLAVSSDYNSGRKVVDLARRHAEVYGAIGIHPHSVRSFGRKTLPALARLAEEPKVVAVGEVGLDFYRSQTSRKAQLRAFQEQVGLAKELKRPLVIHCREAEEEILHILREERAWQVGGIVHCFTGSYEFGKAVLGLDFLLGVGGVLTFEKSDTLRDAVERLPIEDMVVETDSPYLAPAPHRGRRNEPAYVRHTAERLAEVKGLSLEDVARVTNYNVRRALGFGPEPPGPTVSYLLGDSLYLNVTAECNNACFFCGRLAEPVVLGYDLHLERDPTVEEMVAAVGEPGRYAEVVFCGFGEPTLRLEEVKEVARRLRALGARRIRLNTNGLGNLIHGRNILPELVGLMDALSISLNAESKEKYLKVCKPEFGEGAYDAVKDFMREARRLFADVTATVVDLPGSIDVAACERIAREEVGVEFVARPYFPVS
ncbi:MAG: TatD family hydrolase [Nitrospinota bacterium]